MCQQSSTWFSKSIRICASHWPTGLWKLFITHLLTIQHPSQSLPPLSGDHPTILRVPPLPLASVQIVFYSLFISFKKTGGEGKWLECLPLTFPHLRECLWMWGGDDYASVSARLKRYTTHPQFGPWMGCGGLLELTCVEVNEVMAAAWSEHRLSRCGTKNFAVILWSKR